MIDTRDFDDRFDELEELESALADVEYDDDATAEDLSAAQEAPLATTKRQSLQSSRRSGTK